LFSAAIAVSLVDFNKTCILCPAALLFRSYFAY